MPPALHLDRRSFLRRTMHACACAVAARVYEMHGSVATALARPWLVSPSLRLGVVVIDSNDEYATTRMGVELSMEEATRAASLLGGTVEVVGRASSLDDALALVRRGQLSAIVCAGSANEIAELGRALPSQGGLLFNVSSADDSLRNARCARFTFHVQASDAMRQSALETAAPSAATEPPSIELWDHRLERFGAGQLNDRFRSRFQRPMDSAAWAAWFAVKAAWEATLRSRSSEPASIATYLERDTAQFDGQKGVPLSFRRWDHQLRQPLYAVSASASRAPIPIPASESGSSRAMLDALGTPEAASACQWQ